MVTYEAFSSNIIWNNFSLGFPFVIMLTGGYIINREYTDDITESMMTISRFSAKVTDGEIDCHRSANCTVWRVQFHLYDCRCYPAELWQYGCCGGFAVFV